MLLVATSPEELETITSELHDRRFDLDLFEHDEQAQSRFFDSLASIGRS